MEVFSAKYPELLIADLGIRFRDGRAEVTDPEHIARLRGLGALGVDVPDEGKQRGAATAKAAPSVAKKSPARRCSATKSPFGK